MLNKKHVNIISSLCSLLARIISLMLEKTFSGIKILFWPWIERPCVGILDYALNTWLQYLPENLLCFCYPSLTVYHMPDTMLNISDTLLYWPFTKPVCQNDSPTAWTLPLFYYYLVQFPLDKHCFSVLEMQRWKAQARKDRLKNIVKMIYTTLDICTKCFQLCEGIISSMELVV